MTAPTNATHWVSGEMSLETAWLARITSGNVMSISGALAATTDKRPALRRSDLLKARSSGGFRELHFYEVVSIERTRDDDGRPSSSGAAIIYLREVSR